MVIRIVEAAGGFAENKDVARQLRLEIIMPGLELGKKIELDFTGVTGATQSFIHALISDPIRVYGDKVYDNLLFVNCSAVVEEVVNIVADYMQESGE